MSRIKRYGKIIIFDTLAGICFIGVAVFGWLPGPGGLPLFLAGLSLLAVNHAWAERLLETTKHKGMALKKYIFPANPLIRGLYDFLSFVLLFGGGTLLFITQDRIISAIGVAIICFGLVIFLLNRDRSDKLSAYIKRRRKKS